MMPKVLVAIAVGFVVAIPLTFWLLKKVRIKSKIRHFQVSLAIGLPTTLFVFLLQTSLKWILLIVTLFVTGFFLAIESILRYLVRGTRSLEVSIDQGRNGSQVSFDQAKIDSGRYPEDYLTENVWSEMQTFLKQRAQQSKPSNIAKKLKTATDGIDTKRLRGFQIYRHISIKGPNFSVSDGIRNTTDGDRSLCRNKIFIFGGSTVFCDEMPDRLTSGSFLQRLINQEMKPMEVVNCGWSGASILDRTKMLKELINFDKGDIAIFYFGDNDSGWHHSTKEGIHLSEELLPLSVQAMKYLNNTFGLEVAGWVYNELAPRWMRKYSEFAVGATTDALKDAHEYCRSREVEMLVILQPNLYTLRTKHPSEVRAEKRFSNNLRTVILHAYKHYEEWVKEMPYAVSATHIFDNAPAPVFLDWAHVNARGNEIIAKFIFEELQRREMLSSDSKL